jgi:leader peptidase (prepilin peptidase)/N-methyltransferase
VVLLATLIFVAGLAMGSFINVVAYRVPRGESIVHPGSHCPSCDHAIAFYDNLPVISWLALRGRCRHCGEAIRARYPLVELAGGVLFAVTFVVFGTGSDLVLGLAFVSVLLAITVTDLEHRIIPNKVLIVGAIAGLAITAATDPGELPERLAAAAAAGGLLLVAALAYPGGMGMGDVKLGAVMGLYLGRAVAPALLAGFAAGALVGIALLISRGAAARKQAVPFGPFLALGGLIGLYAGVEIVSWYTGTFFHG